MERVAVTVINPSKIINMPLNATSGGVNPWFATSPPAKGGARGRKKAAGELQSGHLCTHTTPVPLYANTAKTPKRPLDPGTV